MVLALQNFGAGVSFGVPRRGYVLREVASLHFRNEQVFSCSYSTAQNPLFLTVSPVPRCPFPLRSMVMRGTWAALENANLRGANPRPLDPSGAKGLPAPCIPRFKVRGSPPPKNPTPHQTPPTPSPLPFLFSLTPCSQKKPPRPHPTARRTWKPFAPGSVMRACAV